MLFPGPSRLASSKASQSFLISSHPAFHRSRQSCKTRLWRSSFSGHGMFHVPKAKGPPQHSAIHLSESRVFFLSLIEIVHFCIFFCGRVTWLLNKNYLIIKKSSLVMRIKDIASTWQPTGMFTVSIRPSTSFINNWYSSSVLCPLHFPVWLASADFMPRFHYVWRNTRYVVQLRVISCL